MIFPTTSPAARSGAAASLCFRPTSSPTYMSGRSTSRRRDGRSAWSTCAIPTSTHIPRFRDALKTAQVAELEPGDAIFIPSMWWHHVEALEAVQRAGQLLVARHARASSPSRRTRSITPCSRSATCRRDEKQLWRQYFDHYVFGDPAAAAAHVPESARGILGSARRRERGANPRQFAAEPVAMSGWPCAKS